MSANTEHFIVECPHCEQKIEVVELNCRIFRCGIIKSNGQQMDPHTPKEVCDQLKQTDSIYGCGRPFRIDASGCAIVCDYI